MNRLIVDEITSVGVVDAGDNPDAQIVFYKVKDHAAPENPPTMPEASRDTAKQRKENEVENFDLSALDDEQRQAVLDHIAALTKRAEDAEAQLPQEEPEPSPELAKRDEEIAKLRAQVEDEVNKRRVAEFTKTAEAHELFLGEPAKDIGPVLADIAAKAPESWEKLSGWMATASERVSMAKLLEEHGGTGQDISDKDTWVETEFEKRGVPEGHNAKSFRALLRSEWERSNA